MNFIFTGHIKKSELKAFLDSKVEQYHQPDFIASDPIQIPRMFSSASDIEIAGFLTATIAWGNRKSIINNATRLMEIMDNSPADFIRNHEDSDLSRLNGFVHRTFNDTDAKTFMRSLKRLTIKYGSIENVFAEKLKEVDAVYQESAFAKAYLKKSPLQIAISLFKQEFFNLPHEKRTQKHVSDPLKNSSAKRINMFLRWMVRDNKGVDFGIWKNISPNQLSLPLDVHTGNVARKLGILKRKQNDARAVAELDNYLRKLDPIDPIKYDFALFGLGAFKEI